MCRHMSRPALCVFVVLNGFAFAFAGDDLVSPAKVKPPKMTLRRATTQMLDNQRFLILTIELSNPNNASFCYTGYQSNSFDPPLKEGQIAPLCQVELRQNGEWQPNAIGRCGTGLADLELKAKSSATFQIMLPNDDWQAAKVAIGQFPGWSSEELTTTTVWSTEITRQQIEAAMRPAHN